ncbi:MAG TPA: type II toxin-antitoxin system RelE/ParE family toxin [Solirubrobacteraceae bacterium]
MTGEQPWDIGFTRRARKDMDRLDPPVRRRIYAALGRLAAGDLTLQERRLANLSEWRIRVGDWRVRFTRNIETRTIAVQRVLPRGRAYER